MPIVNVIANITTKPGMRDEVLRIFKDNIPDVLAEDGCIEYGPTIDMEGVGDFQTPVGPDTYVVIEKWENLKALMIHLKAPHMLAYREKVKDLVEGTELKVLKDAGTV